MIPLVEYGDDRLPDRFWAQVYPEPNTGCWLWGGAVDSDGYGVATIARTRRRCHQWTWDAIMGPPPDGLVRDHYVCQNPPCCNPEHLEIVTQGENARRGRSYWRGLTACRRGHPFTPENTRRRKDGGRDCIECDRIRGAKYRQSSKAKAAAAARQRRYAARKRTSVSAVAAIPAPRQPLQAVRA
jgi:hypothetical protein